MSNDKIYWKFKATSKDQFTMRLDFQVEYSLIKKLFNQAVIEAKKKLGKKGEGDPTRLPIIPIPTVYHNKIRWMIRPVFTKNINKDLAIDGVKIVSYDVVDAQMENFGDIWKVEINLKGVYTK